MKPRAIRCSSCKTWHSRSYKDVDSGYGPCRKCGTTMKELPLRAARKSLKARHELSHPNPRDAFKGETC